MKYGKQYQSAEVSSVAIKIICEHYSELYDELVHDRTTVRCSETAEDLLHTAILFVAVNVSDKKSDIDIIAEVRRKYHSLRIGLEHKERTRREVLRDKDITEQHADDNEE